MYGLKPVPFKGGDTQDYFNKLLEQFSNSCALLSSVQGGFFLRKKPLIIVLSVYSNWRTPIVWLPATPQFHAATTPPAQAITA